MARGIINPALHTLDHARTTWHITWGTYGTRLPGGDRPTVSRHFNERGAPFIRPNPEREDTARESMRGDAVYLTHEQQLFVQDLIPKLCVRGGWTFRACAAAPDHVHAVVDALPAIHGEKIRRLVKRWIGQAMSARWGVPTSETWWAREGSNKAVKNQSYLENVTAYVWRQRAQAQ